MIGFTFVNIINLQNERHNPILDNHMSPNSFYKTVLIVGPVFFINSGIFMMRGAHDICGHKD